MFIDTGEIIGILRDRLPLMKKRVSTKIKPRRFIKDYFLSERVKLNHYGPENLLPKV